MEAPSQEELTHRAKEFERNHGSHALLSTVLELHNRILVDAGIITEENLRREMMVMFDNAEDALEDKRKQADIV